MNPKHIVGDAEAGQRLDNVLATCLGISRSALRKRLDPHSLRLDGRVVSWSRILQCGEILQWELQESARESSLVPVPPTLNILFEDEWLLVLNKPAGLVVHPGAGDNPVTLIHGLRAYLGSEQPFADPDRLGLVHRLDKDTTGVLLVAKNPDILERMQKQFASRSVKKEYHALVRHGFSEDHQVISLPIGRHPKDGKRMAVNGRNPREAVTRLKVCERFGDFTYVVLQPETGRTHQIRVHCQMIRHPILGDPIYGGGGHYPGWMSKPKRPLLHARTLSFTHPIQGEWVSFKAPLPDDFTSLLEVLRGREGS